MMSMGEFADDLEKFATTFPSTADTVVRLAALEALANIVVATPRDTGRAASNWFASIDSPDDTTTEETDVQANLTEQTAKLNRPTPCNSIWISNNLPYIVRLNEGWSKQAPAGFVQKAMVAAERSLKNAKLWV